MTSQTQICVIQSQNQQQPIVPIQLLFQHSSQPECSPVYSQNISAIAKILSSRTSHTNSRPYMTSLPLWVKRRCAISENLPTQKVILCSLHHNNVVGYWIFTEFNFFSEIHEFYWILSIQVLNSQSIEATITFNTRRPNELNVLCNRSV